MIRLTKNEIVIIKEIINNIFVDAKVYLFGSRLDTTKKGGDIDLYVDTKDKNNLLEKKIKALSKLERVLSKPVDLVVSRNKTKSFEKEIIKNCKLL